MAVEQLAKPTKLETMDPRMYLAAERLHFCLVLN